jgi:hypothetical protein
MKNPLPVQLRRGEVVGGIIWLLVYLVAIDSLVYLALVLLGLPTDLVTMNQVYFVTNFLITALVFHHFLADSLGVIPHNLGRFFKGLLFGFCLYEVFQVGLGILCDLVLPDLATPNDDTIEAIAQDSYWVMWVGAVLLAPMTEEALLRGLVFGGLRKKSRLAAYLVTALLFGLMHTLGYIMDMDALTFVLNLLLYAMPSVALCACYEYSGTIWCPIALHMILNAISMSVLGA